MKISVITPSIRIPELLLTLESLKKQNFDPKEFEWLICSPFNVATDTRFYNSKFLIKWYPEPAKNPHDFMGENKAYNVLFKNISGDLVITLNDAIYLKENALQVFWDYYLLDTHACVCFMGNHYEKIVNGKGEHITYEDVRVEQVHSDYESCGLINFDACCSSIPAKAIEKAGSIDPVWDEYCCWGIRELMWKIRNLGYKLFISKVSSYLGQKHTKEYDPDDRWQQLFESGDIKWREKYGIPD